MVPGPRRVDDPQEFVCDGEQLFPIEEFVPEDVAEEEQNPRPTGGNVDVWASVVSVLLMIGGFMIDWSIHGRSVPSKTPSYIPSDTLSNRSILTDPLAPLKYNTL